MAAVTINSNKYNVNGSLRDQYYNLTGNNGDTLTIGLFTVRKVNTQVGTAITAITTAAGTNPGTTTITFATGGGAFTAEQVQVVGN